MRAGYARVKMTPPLGTKMMGVGGRDLEQGCTSIHDDIYIRTLYAEHEGERALIMSLDTCFVGRDDCDKWKGLIGRHTDLLPRQILIMSTHSHVGPAIGTWYAAGHVMPDRVYANILDNAMLEAARTAIADARPATIEAAAGRSQLPMNRRRVNPGAPSGENGLGTVDDTANAPNPGGSVCDVLPVCLLKDDAGLPIALLFSIATHPSILRDHIISAEYPGVACDALDAHLGKVCSLFLQGTGGDSKPSSIVDADNEWRWKADWEDAERTGKILAEETIAVLQGGLQPVQPKINSAIIDIPWPLQAPPERAYFEGIVAQTDPDYVLQSFAARQLQILDGGGTLAAACPVLTHGIQLGEGLRLIAMEGEPMAAHGHMMLKEYPDGVTFPLGYANGEAMYLVMSHMLPEGGMEPTSFWEYGWPAPLAPGTETYAQRGILAMRVDGVE